MTKGANSKASKPSAPTRNSTTLWGWDFWNFGFKHGGELSPRAATFLLGLLLVIWLVGGAYLLLVSETMVTARRIQALRDELAYWHKENAILEAQISIYTNVQELMRLAEQEGFVPATQTDFVEP